MREKEKRQLGGTNTMLDDNLNPLSDVHLASLNKCINECMKTKDYLHKCKSCGIDVEEEIAKNQQTLMIGQSIKQTFFPGER